MFAGTASFSLGSLELQSASPLTSNPAEPVTRVSAANRAPEILRLIRSRSCSSRIVRTQDLPARLCGIGVDQHESNRAGLRAVVDPRVHGAALYNDIALPDAQRFAL